MIKIALPKGNVISKSYGLISKYVTVPNNTNCLYFTDGKLYDFYLLKYRDIPKFIYEEKIDIGITTTEWLIESQLSIQIAKNIDWYRGRISLLSKDSTALKKNSISCVTEYVHIARNFFINEHVKKHQINYISGSTEGLIPRLYDCSIDCVETGRTFKSHDLQEEAILFPSQTHVIVKDKQKLAKFASLIDNMFY